MGKRILPAYPLWVIDPMFSIWAKTDDLNGGDTIFWTGAGKRIYGFVRWENRTYGFLGRHDGVVPLEQTALEVHAFSTDYTFRCDQFSLRVRFISPRIPGERDILSCPVCYTEYEVTEGELPADFSISIVLDEGLCYGDERASVMGGVIPLAGYEAGYFTRLRNLVCSDTSDRVAPDWGDVYLTAQESWYISESGLNLYLLTGQREYLRKDGERVFLLAVNTARSGYFMTAFDEKLSVFYFGEWLKAYYFRDGKTIIDALGFFASEHDNIVRLCDDFDRKLKEDCEQVGKDFYVIACAAMRQSVAAHILTRNSSGELLFLSKENDSNGCIGTVDVSYPSVPLYLLYDPELVNAMLRGIYAFSGMPVWNYEFAPHDLGTYPWCSGQVYGTVHRDDKYCCGGVFTSASPRTNQMLYFRPAESDIYDASRQMPVEECGNMLIMQAAAIRAGADCRIAKKNFPLLRMWVKYLERYGLDPGSQLCTDDFAGHLAGNLNLSIKALVGIEAFSVICSALGKKDLAQNYAKKARAFAEKFLQKAGDGVMPLAYGQEGTFSLKYNLLFDQLFGFHLIDQAVCERETDEYLARSNRYGTPLDSRESYTKADWLCWVCALTDDAQKRQKLYAPIIAYLAETPSRLPFGDWYYSDRGDILHFINRSVVGGCFAPLLKLSGKCGKI